MNRRRFLSTTMLTSVGLAALSAPAKAFHEHSCDGATDVACRELTQHHEVLAALNTLLTQKGLSDEQKQVVLAAAVCPFCGQPLI